MTRLRNIIEVSRHGATFTCMEQVLIFMLMEVPGIRVTAVEDDPSSVHIVNFCLWPMDSRLCSVFSSFIQENLIRRPCVSLGMILNFHDAAQLATFTCREQGLISRLMEVPLPSF